MSFLVLRVSLEFLSSLLQFHSNSKQVKQATSHCFLHTFLYQMTQVHLLVTHVEFVIPKNLFVTKYASAPHRQLHYHYCYSHLLILESLLDCYLYYYYSPVAMTTLTHTQELPLPTPNLISLNFCCFASLISFDSPRCPIHLHYYHLHFRAGPYSTHSSISLKG